MKITDSLGHSVRVGDILIEWWGGSATESKFNVWEFPRDYDGQGIRYSQSGEKDEFRWCRVGESCKLDLSTLPKSFLYSFKHGMDTVTIKHKDWNELKEMGWGNILKRMEWEEVSPRVVKRSRKLDKLTINSMEDLVRNIELFDDNVEIPYRIVHQIFDLFGFERADVVNGEIGIASIEDFYWLSVALGWVRKIKQESMNPRS